MYLFHLPARWGSLVLLYLLHFQLSLVPVLDVNNKTNKEVNISHHTVSFVDRWLKGTPQEGHQYVSKLFPLYISA